jgi:hypothetical protein
MGRRGSSRSAEGKEDVVPSDDSEADTAAAAALKVELESFKAERVSDRGASVPVRIERRTAGLGRQIVLPCGISGGSIGWAATTTST